MVFKSDNTENTLESFFSEEDIKSISGEETVYNEAEEEDLTEYDDEEVEYEEVVVRKPIKKSKPVEHKQIVQKPVKKVETLSDFMEQQEYVSSKEYKEQVNEVENISKELSNPNNIANILSMANVKDLNKITINDESKVFNEVDNFNFILNSKPTYQVTLNQSAYIAHIEGMRFSDIFSINQSVGNNFETTLRQYQTYFKKINSNSLGIKSFDEFTKLTSLYDVPTIEFGLFNQTFPGDTEFNIRCKHCGQEMKKVKISNDQLITAKNDEVYEQLDRVINSIDSVKKAEVHSLVNKVDRIQLPVSKSIIEIHIPTIADQLDILKEIRESNFAQVEDYIDVLLYTKDIYVVDLVATKEKGEPVFNKCKNRNEILMVIKNLTLDDIKVFNEAISGKDSKYRIDYMIKSFPCTNCHKEVGDVSIDIQQLLFQETLLQLV